MKNLLWISIFGIVILFVPVASAVDPDPRPASFFGVVTVDRSSVYRFNQSTPAVLPDVAQPPTTPDYNGLQTYFKPNLSREGEKRNV